MNLVERIKTAAVWTASRFGYGSGWYGGGALDRGPRGGGWYPFVREPYSGAWQRNNELSVETVLNYAPVWACVTLIAADIAKMRLRLVEETDEDVWQEVENPAYSPVLRRPNHFQTIHKFVEQWITSKLIHGNTYVLKERDARGVVSALYVLDPTRVLPMVTADGSVYYDLERDDLAGLTEATLELSSMVPASEIIHDTGACIFHPLVGVSPIFASGLPALQGLKIQDNQTRLFANGSQPGGILTAPGALNEEQAMRLKAYWESEFTGFNVGKIAVVGDGLKYEPMSLNAVDAQLIDQLNWTAVMICTTFHVPPFMIGLSDREKYANAELNVQQYYAQCLQSHVTNFEAALDDGLELRPGLGVEFDVDDLIWMDTATRGRAANDAISSGALSPNEARAKYYGLGPVVGGDTPYLQQQNFSLSALAQRDASNPFAVPAPALAAAPAAPEVLTREWRDEFLRTFAELTRAS